MAENPLTKLPLAGQLGVASGLAAAILGGFWYFWWNPKTEEETKKAKDLASLREEIRALEVTAAKLAEFQREVQILEAKLETLKRILPPEKEVPDLMRKFQTLAASSNLYIRKFEPAAVKQQEFYQEFPIRVELDGTYHNLGVFFDRISREPRLINVVDVKVRAPGNQTPSKTVEVATTAKTYVYVEQPAAAQPPKKK